MQCLKNVVIQRRNGNYNNKKIKLLKAAQEGNCKRVVELLKGGADVNSTDGYGLTALMHASWNGRYEVVKELWLWGADLEKRDCRGTTALHYASTGKKDNDIISVMGCTVSMEYLLERGANIEAQENLAGNTALHLAVMMGGVTTLRVKLLLDKMNIDCVNIRNLYGKTALDIALEKGDRTLADIILEAVGETSGGDELHQDHNSRLQEMSQTGVVSDNEHQSGSNLWENDWDWLDDQQTLAEPPGEYTVVAMITPEASHGPISKQMADRLIQNGDKLNAGNTSEIGDVGFARENLCAICLATKTKKCVFLNCFHSSCCLQCALEIMKSEKVSTCPICRSPIADVKEIYD